MIKNTKIAFFGSSRFSVVVLERMVELGVTPDLVVTTPDKPQGRKLILTPNIVKTWALHHKIEVLNPEKLTPEFTEILKKNECQLFIVASYGKIIPQRVLDLPQHQVLNIHPSLLPIYRGASPLQSAILDDAKETGVSIMRLDKEMDHGPIIAQKNVTITEWPNYSDFEEMMAKIGAELLVDTLPGWIDGNIKEVEQNHSRATFTRKINKEDGLIKMSDDPYKNFLKIQAFSEWPVAYFMHNHKGRDIRVKIKEASFENGKLTIKKVVPEGSKEMSYEDFLKGYGFPL